MSEPVSAPLPAPKPYQCRHIFTAGHQCGSPALRGEELCFYHHASRRPVTHKRLHGVTFLALPAPDDFHAIGRGLAEVLRLCAESAIDDRHAATLIRGLAVASANLARAERHRKSNPVAASEIVQDFVHDPLLGTLAPAPNPTSEARPALAPEPLPRHPSPSGAPASPALTPRHPAPSERPAFPEPVLTPEPLVVKYVRSPQAAAEVAALYAGFEAEVALHNAARALKPPTAARRFLEQHSRLAPPATPSQTTIPVQTSPVQTYPTPNQDFGLREKTNPPDPTPAFRLTLPEPNPRLPSPSKPARESCTR